MAQTRPFLERHCLHVLILVMGGLFISFLRVTPLHPEGYFIHNIIQQGGVSLPPGNPLLIWFYQIIDLLSPFSTAQSLAVTNSMLACLTLLVIDRICRQMHFNKIERIYFCLAICLFPGFSFHAIQISKYGPFSLLSFVCLYWLVAKKLNSKKYFLGQCLLIAMLISTHYLGVVFAVLLLPYIYYLRQDFKTIFSGLALLTSIALFFYISLIGLTAIGDGWPSWGKVQGIKDLYHFLFSFEHGFLKNDVVARTDHAKLIFAGGFFLKQALYCFPLWFFFICFGILKMSRDYRQRAFFIVLLFLGIGFTFWLIRGPIEIDSLMHYERYSITFLSSFLVLTCLGLHSIIGLISKNKRRLFDLGLLLLLILQAYLYRDYYRGLGNKIPDIYLKSVQHHLDSEAIYLAQNDVLLFNGVENKEGKRTYPIGFFFPYPWYRAKAMAIEPRIGPALKRLDQQEGWNYYAFIGELLKDGLTVVADNRNDLARSPYPVEQRGFLFYTGVNINKSFGPQALAAAQLVCAQLVEHKSYIPTQLHYFTKGYVSPFKRVFMAAASYLKLNQRETAAQAAFNLAKFFAPGSGSAVWQKYCPLFAK